MDSELETKIAQFAAILNDEQGNPRPIERIEFEPLGRQVRFTIWSQGTRLQSITAAMRDLDGLLEATKLILACETGDPSGIDLDQLDEPPKTADGFPIRVGYFLWTYDCANPAGFGGRVVAGDDLEKFTTWYRSREAAAAAKGKRLNGVPL